jgi:Winged helix-turn-helix DNA-binding
MADFLSQTRTDLDTRLKELRPLYEEYLKLEKAKAALEGLDGPRRGPGRPRGSGTSKKTAPARSGNGRRRRRRRRGGTRAEQALAVIRENPGITVTELAPKVGISQKNYLYRVMNGLAADGLVRKEGRGYRAK